MSTECTGIAASWCPNCGTCSCSRHETGERAELNDSCALHGDSTKHAATLCAGGCGEIVSEHGERCLQCLRCEVERLKRDLADARAQVWTDARRLAYRRVIELARVFVRTADEFTPADGSRFDPEASAQDFERLLYAIDREASLWEESEVVT